MKDTLQAIITEFFLSQSPERAYYSEAAMQLKLGIELWRRLGVEPEMERRCPQSGKYLDILVKWEGIRYGIELKYKTKFYHGFQYTQQGAQDHGRYDFIYDVSRIESFMASGFIDAGFACFVTNDSLYWSSLRDMSFAKAFQLTEGTTLSGTYTPTWKKRTKVIELQRQYPVEWLTTPQAPPGSSSFKALSIEVN